jgi:drug/metabolite transporter (DMT)-like permease
LFSAGLFLFVSNVCYTYAIKLGNPVIGAAWQTTTPIFCALAAVVIGVEKPTQLKVIGILVAFGGATFVVLYGGTAVLATKSIWLSHVLFFSNVNAW